MILALKLGRETTSDWTDSYWFLRGSGGVLPMMVRVSSPIKSRRSPPQKHAECAPRLDGNQHGWSCMHPVNSVLRKRQMSY